MTVFITDTQFEYTPHDAMRNSFTVGEFLDFLERRGVREDDKIILSCDGGYSYRSVNEHSVQVP